MKRTPLKRKTPMKRGGPLKRTKLKAVSSKTAVALAEYRRLRTPWMAARPLCDARCADTCKASRARSVHVHHMAGRGPNLNRVETWLAVCSPCHDWIHAHPKKARSLSLLA